MKAKLVIEIPSNCYDCKLSGPSMTIGLVCVPMLKHINSRKYQENRAEWCPLIPLEESEIERAPNQ
jgi:hypothetical protein